MKIFATRTWGFRPETYPVISFVREGDRDKLLKESEIGDVILIVGTQGEPTEENERGRLLGIAQIGRIAVDTLTVLDESEIRPHDYDAHGNYRWPKALAMTRAWYFPSKPLLKDVLAQQLPYNATTQAVLLNEDDTSAIMALQAEEALIPETEAVAKLKKLESALLRGKPTRGVIPSAWSSRVVRELGRKSVTYALRYGKSDCWKIGHTVDVKQRLSDINKHIPYEITGEKWELFRTQSWENETLAYEMEQGLFNDLFKFRTAGERLQCKEEDLHIAWLKSIGL
ncbi:MAG: hypothetical protein R3D71_02270 [Rickettsiales bacterium]